MKSASSRPLPDLPKGNLALGVPALCCACQVCHYSLSAHLGPELESLVLKDMKALFQALPEPIMKSLEVFGKLHADAGHEISVGLVYLVPMAPTEPPS